MNAQPTTLLQRAVECRKKGDGAGALALALEAEALLRDTDEVETYCKALLSIGRSYGNLGEYSRALGYHEQALALADGLNAPTLVGAAHFSLGSALLMIGSYDDAIKHLHAALEIFQQERHEAGIASVHANLGLVYYSVSDFAKAFEYYHKGLDYVSAANELDQMSTAYNNIGTVYESVGEFATANSHYEQGLEIARTIGNRRHEGLILSSMATNHRLAGDLQRALQCFTTARPLLEETNDTATLSFCLAGLCQVFLDLEQINDARTVLEDLNVLVVEDPTVQVSQLICEGRILASQGAYESALSTLQSALQLATAFSAGKFEAEVLFHLRQLAFSMNDLQGYVQYNIEHQAKADAVRGQDTVRRLSVFAIEKQLAHERQEREKERAVLHSTLPKHIADRVARGEVVNDHFDNAAVLFVDIVGFTTLSASMTSADVVNLLDTVFASFDAICQKHGVTKIKTIGDSYMAVAFREQPNSRITEQPNSSSEQRVASLEERAASAALDMLDAVTHNLPNGLLEDLPDGLPNGLQVRIGLHTGPVTAGIIGKERMQYDVWGDTVNVASRMENTSEPGMIHVSEAFANALNSERAKERKSDEPRSSSPFPVPSSLRERGALEIKGKGMMTTYWLEAHS